MPSSDPATGEAMRRIAIRGVLFLVPVLLAWGMLEWWMIHIPDSHSIKRENLAKVEPEIDTLVLGASASFWDVPTTFVPKICYAMRTSRCITQRTTGKGV